MNKIYVVTVTIFTLAGTVYAGAGGGSHSHGDKHWNAPSYTKFWGNPVEQNRRSANKGEIIFQKNCISCHGKSANGDGPLAKTLTPKPTNLRMMSGMHADGDFAWKIYNGRGSMPSWKETLKQKEIWHLVNYIQSLSKKTKLAKIKTSHAHDDKKHGH